MSKMIEDTNNEILEMNIAGSPAAIKLENVKFIQIIEDVVPIPKAPNFVLGITKIEDTVVPLIDLDILLEVEDLIEGNNSIGILISTEDNLFGIHTRSLPNVAQTSDMSPNEKFDMKRMPEEWKMGEYKKDDKIYPLLEPKSIWKSLGDIKELQNQNGKFRTSVKNRLGMSKKEMENNKADIGSKPEEDIDESKNTDKIDEHQDSTDPNNEDKENIHSPTNDEMEKDENISKETDEDSLSSNVDEENDDKIEENNDDGDDDNSSMEQEDVDSKSNDEED